MWDEVTSTRAIGSLVECLKVLSVLVDFPIDRGQWRLRKVDRDCVDTRLKVKNQKCRGILLDGDETP